MAVGKISELVDDSAITQLQALYEKLGITTQAMVAGTDAAAGYIAAISKVNTISEFNAANQQTVNVMGEVKQAQQNVIAVQKEATTATNQIVEATKAKLIADADASTVLTKLGGDISANVKLLVEQKIELGQVTTQLKEHTTAVGADSGAQVRNIETTAKLTQQQLLLKEAIAQNNLVIKQQVKEQLAAETSNNVYMAQLNQMIKLQNAMSVSERENTAYGKELQAQITATREAVVAANEAQGKFNDNVGNYPGKAEPAIAAVEKTGKSFDITGRLASVLTSRIFRMAASFLLITVALGAVTWLAKWISGLDYFTGRLDLAVQSLKNFNDIMKSSEADSGKQVGSLRILYDATQDVTLSMKDRLTAAKELQKLYPDQFEASKTQALLNGDEKKSYDELTQSIIENARADAAKVKIQEIESRIIDEQADKIKIRNARMNQLSAVKEDIINGSVGGSAEAGGGTGTLDITTKARQKEMINQEADAAQQKKDINIKSYNDQIAIIEKVIGFKKLVKSVTDDDKDPKKVKDIADNDEIANAKAKLELVKARAKEILDSEKSSYEQRLTALKIFIDASNRLIENERVAKNNKPGATAKEKDTNNTEAQTQGLGVTAFDASEKLKIQKEAIADFKKTTHDLNTDVTDDLKESLNQQNIAIEQASADRIKVLTDEFAARKISEKDYNQEVKLINDRANEQKIQAEIDTYKQILAIQEAFATASALTGLPLGASTPKDIQGTKNKIATSEVSLTKAQTTIQTDSGKHDNSDQKEKEKQVLSDVQTASDIFSSVSELIDQQAAAKIAGLEQQAQLIEKNAELEKETVNNSILSNKSKARQIAIIDAQAASAKEAIAEKEKKIKRDQAKADKAISIAKIIENTAVGIASALALEPAGIALAIIVGALGAAQLAVVASQPIPAFKHGGTVSKDGYIQTGEAGTELRIDPSGSMSFTADRTNVSYAKAGTKIISNKELMNIVGKPEPVYYTNDTKVDNKKLEKLMAENNQLQRERKQRIIVNTGDRWGDYSRRRNY